MSRPFAILIAFIAMLAMDLKMQASEAEREPLPCLNKKFSIVSHIVIDSLGVQEASEAAITSAIEDLNEIFSEICVSFEICEFRYVDNFQYDTLIYSTEWEQAIIDYHVANRINMFFVSNIDEDPDICGKATLGGIAMMNSGGISILNSCISGNTIPHEMGHYFGLSHTFEGAGEELVDGSNCDTAGDGICDTPADPYDEDADGIVYVDENCRFIYTGLDANGEYYDPHVGNIMSYYPCACEFSYEQYQHMAEVYLNSNPKMW